MKAEIHSATPLNDKTIPDISIKCLENNFNGKKKISRNPSENHSRDQPDLMDFIETYFWEPD